MHFSWELMVQIKQNGGILGRNHAPKKLLGRAIMHADQKDMDWKDPKHVRTRRLDSASRVETGDLFNKCVIRIYSTLMGWGRTWT